MIRRFLLYLSTARWARAMTSRFFLARRVALRFVAGETLTEALEVVRRLNADGLKVTLDYLGESVEKAEDTVEVVEMYVAAVKAIHTQKLGSGISLKPTHLGLDISQDLCINNLRTILQAAKDADNMPVTMDMESTAYTDTTIGLYRTLRDEYGFTNFGTVIQAYLYRSREDMKQLAAEGSHIRLCKGAYLEPATVAFPEKADVDDHYRQLVDDYVQSAPPAYLCIATHDENMIQSARTSVQTHATPKDRFEFQMLYGIRSSRQVELAKEGFTVRVYVPFGVTWYPYFMRRLAERPANLWFFAKSLFSR